MSKKYDVCAIGNAMVDYEIDVNDEFFQANGVEKGLMTLVDEEKQRELMRLVDGKIKKKQGGGSAANTVYGLSKLGGTSFYTCRVANDEDGIFFMNDLTSNGIDTNLSSKQLLTGITGKCLVMVTPDAERTMNTYLGITTNFSVDDLKEEAIKNSTYLYMEGALVSSETGFEAMLKSKEIAEENAVKTSLTFWDPSMVKYFGDQMKAVVGDGVDLLFCNVEEGKLYTGLDDLENVKKNLEQIAKQFVITFGKDGSLVFDGSDYTYIDPFPTKAIDSTGAGDVYAGAFLYGITHGKSFPEAGKLASAASSAVVSKYGPRLEDNQVQEVLNKV